MVGTNVFGPCISGPDLMVTIGITQHNMQMFLADMSADSSHTLDPIITMETTEIYSLVMR